MPKIATLNLFHWAEPGIRWISAHRTHSPASWRAKRDWLAATLTAIDADAVALQEVVSVDALRETAAAAGYPYCATIAEPILDQAAETGQTGAPARIYRRAVNAVISRTPMTAAPISVRPHLAAALGLHEGRHLRRPPIAAELELPGLGPATLIGVHLKSPGAVSGETQLAGAQAPTTPAEAARARVEGLARSHGAAAIQRLYEATALQHDVTERIARSPRRPVIVLGDFNDAPDSPTLRALLSRAGGAPEAEPDPSAELWRLVDAQRLAPRSLRRDARTPTHLDGADARTLDYILVSSALHPWRPDRVGDVVATEVFAPWFDGGDPTASSDHAAVVTTLQPRA